MSLNQAVSAERVHIGFFGLRNAGKSSLVNAVTGQNLSLVSNVLGTTTDPVKKAMELLPLGPVVVIDTPGIDDVGELGMQRVERAKQVLNTTDIAILVTDATTPLSSLEKELIDCFVQKNIPYIVAKNKSDLLKTLPSNGENEIYVSTVTNQGIHTLKEKIAHLSKGAVVEKKILADIITANDTVVLVTPIDESAPKGRLILPQQQVIRELLEIGATTLICQDSGLAATLDKLKERPRLVITDSQVFGKVSAILPKDILLTSFSILFARYKGDLDTAVHGAAALKKLKDGDTVLISEGCTHHRQCKDIGSVKIPAWVKNYSGKELCFEFTAGGDFPADLKKYALVIHCGGCMLTEKEMKNRIETAKAANIPITNYGIAIAEMHGILARSLELFPQVLKHLD